MHHRLVLVEVAHDVGGNGFGALGIAVAELVAVPHGIVGEQPGELLAPTSVGEEGIELVKVLELDGDIGRWRGVGAHQIAVSPPSTTSWVPVMKLASSDNKKQMAAANSSGSPSRFKSVPSVNISAPFS